MLPTPRTVPYFAVGLASMLALACAVAAVPPPVPPLDPPPSRDTPGVVYPSDVRDFVKLIFVHGVPYDGAVRFGPAATPALLAILADPAQEAAWSNTVVTLGMIGDPNAVNPLIQFISQGDGQLGRASYNARTSAIMALGYAANRDPTSPALAYLIASTGSAFWQERVRWQSPLTQDPVAGRLALAEIGVLGLALSGQPPAADALRKVIATSQESKATAEQQRLGLVAQHALAEHAKIAAMGLASYYAPRPRARRTPAPAK